MNFMLTTWILFYICLTMGGIFLLISFIMLRGFMKKLAGTIAYKRWRYVPILIILFLLFYIIIIPWIQIKNMEWLYLTFGLLAFSGSIFVFVIISIGKNTVKDFKLISESVAQANINMAELYANLEEAKSEVERKNNEIATAYADLKNAQVQLIEMEKMAALGQLVSGIAHEINTPISAINAANGNILLVLQENFFKIVETLRMFDEEQWRMLNVLLEKSSMAHQQLTSKDERAYRKVLQNTLEEQNVPDAYDTADTLVDMHIYTVDDCIDFFKTPNFNLTLSLASTLFNLLDNAAIINIAIEKIKKIVFALKSYTHFEHTSEQVAVDVVENMELVLTLYHNQLKYGIEVEKNYQSIPKISGYPDELNQVWTNLVHNSIQAMFGKGKLSINIYEEDGYVYVKVKDTGEGIPKENLDKIFDAFFTTKRKGEGSGLGLNIVKKILERHNGEISVESSPGETIFTVKLPTSGNKGGELQDDA